MTVNNTNGGETLSPGADAPTAKPAEAPAPTPGGPQQLAAANGPAEGPGEGSPETGQLASAEDAWLDPKEGHSHPKDDAVDTAAAAAANPSSFPGEFPSAPASSTSTPSNEDAPTLQTGAGGGPVSGGIGEYLEPSAGVAWHGLRQGTPATETPDGPAHPNLASAAFGPAWTAGAVPLPVGPAPIAYNMIMGTAANNRLNGTVDHDHIAGLAGNDRLYGSDQADWLEGGDGNDRLYGDGGADRLEGGDGNDSLYIDWLDRWVDGGDGNDWVYVQGDHGVALDLTAAHVEYAQGGTGNDVFNADRSTVAVKLYGGDGNDKLTGGDANDRLYGQADNDRMAGGGGNDNLHGGAGNDQIEGGDGNDLLYGEDGADVLRGGAGNDRLYIDASDTLIDGGDGIDTAYVQTDVGVSLDLAASHVEIAYGKGGADSFDASAATETVKLYGRDGDDTLLGGSGNDRLYGQVGDDRVEGGAGNDYLYGDGGADQLLGGAGNDRLYIDADDTLIDGGDGSDTVYVQTDVGVSLDLAASHVEIAYGKGGADSFDASGATDAVRLDGKGGDDTLLGGGGDDLLYGRAGDDVISGGDGNDRLWGHDGADQLIGGDGDDRFSGGDGADSFVFELSFNGGGSVVTGPGADRVLDFDTASDDTLMFTDVMDINGDTHVNLNDLLALEADGRLDVFESGNRVVMEFNGGGSITIDGLATGGIDSLQDMINHGANVVV